MEAKYLKMLESIPPEPLEGRTRYYKGFLYGEYGVGKTKLAAECAENKGLIVATDTGVETIYNHEDLLDKIEVVPYDGLSQLTAIGQAKTEGIEPWNKFDIIIPDTISQMQEEYLDFLYDNYEWKGNLRDKAALRGGTVAAKQSGLPAEVENTGLPDYNLTRRAMSLPIKTLIKAPVNVIFIAHLREPSFLEAGQGKLIRRPTLTETVFKLIAREASWMGLMERDGKKRTIQFQTDRKTVSKSRIKELDDKIINADELPEILKKWSNR